MKLDYHKSVRKNFHSSPKLIANDSEIYKARRNDKDKKFC